MINYQTLWSGQAQDLAFGRNVNWAGGTYTIHEGEYTGGRYRFAISPTPGGVFTVNSRSFPMERPDQPAVIRSHEAAITARPGDRGSIYDFTGFPAFRFAGRSYTIEQIRVYADGCSVACNTRPRGPRAPPDTLLRFWPVSDPAAVQTLRLGDAGEQPSGRSWDIIWSRTTHPVHLSAGTWHVDLQVPNIGWAWDTGPVAGSAPVLIEG